MIYSKRMRAALLRGEMPDWIARHPRRDYWRSLILSTPDWAERRQQRLL